MRRIAPSRWVFCSRICQRRCDTSLDFQPAREDGVAQYSLSLISRPRGRAISINKQIQPWKVNKLDRSHVLLIVQAEINLVYSRQHLTYKVGATPLAAH